MIQRKLMILKRNFQSLKQNIKFALFIKNDIEINDDKFALSELVQFIFRSAIRNGKEILIYLPSKRMRNILQDWINN